jgi:hypothetical protein
MVWLLLSCGTEGAGSLGAGGDQGQATATSRATRTGERAVTTVPNAPGARTLGDALKSLGGQDAEEDATGSLVADQEPTPEQAHFQALQQRIANAGPLDHHVLADALREADQGVQLLALDRLGDMPWDPQARRILEDFQNRETNEGLQRRAADLLNSFSRVVVAHTLAEQAGQDPSLE